MKTKPLTELRDADISRVDAVKGAANGTRFLIAKAAAGEAGLVSAEEVRELIAEPAADTYLGPAGEILKAEMSGADQNDLPDSDFAYVEPGGKVEGGRTTPRSLRHFPINDEAHVRNALSRLPQSPFGSKARPKVEAAARRMRIGEPAEVTKESQMAAPADQVPAASGTNALKDAKAVLKQARLAKKRERLEKQAVRAKRRDLMAQAAKVCKGTLHDLADAHEAILEALKRQEDPETAKRLQSLADDIASCMSDHAMSESGAEEVMEDGAVAEEVVKAEPVQPVSLKKARAAAKAARLEKRTARDRISVAKAQATLAKIGRRNSTSDQSHVDAIDDHAAALGATAHLNVTGTPAVPADLQKAAEDQVAGAIDLIQKAIGPLFGEKLEAIRGDLTEVSQQVAKIAKMPLPGGPRVVLERDGSIVAAPDGERGLSPEQAMLAKVAEKFPVGSVAREEIQKEAAKSAIRDLMEARNQYS